MLINQDKELKLAILALPQDEKDKLILKLVSKDLVLLNQLRYQLIETKSGRTDSFDRAKVDVQRYFITYFGGERTKEYLTSNMLLGYLRELSGIVNEYSLISKDKPGEVDLRLFIFEELFKLNLLCFKPTDTNNQKLLQYVADRLKYIVNQFRKLTDEHQFDLKERLDAVLDFLNDATSQHIINVDKH